MPVADLSKLASLAGAVGKSEEPPKGGGSPSSSDVKFVNEMFKNNMELILKDAHERTDDPQEIEKYFSAITTASREQQVKYIFEMGDQIRAEKFSEKTLPLGISASKPLAFAAGTMSAVTGDMLPKAAGTLSGNLPSWFKSGLNIGQSEEEVRADVRQYLSAAQSAEPIAYGAGNVAAYFSIAKRLGGGKGVLNALGGSKNVAKLINSAISKSTALRMGAEATTAQAAISTARELISGTWDLRHGERGAFDVLVDGTKNILKESATTGAVATAIPLGGAAVNKTVGFGANLLSKAGVPKALGSAGLQGAAGAFLLNEAIDRGMSSMTGFGLIGAGALALRPMRGLAKFVFSKGGEKIKYFTETSGLYRGLLDTMPDVIVAGTGATAEAVRNRAKKDLGAVMKEHKADIMKTLEQHTEPLRSALGEQANAVIEASENLAVSNESGTMRGATALKNSVLEARNQVSSSYGEDLDSIALDNPSAAVNITAAADRFRRALKNQGAGIEKQPGYKAVQELYGLLGGDTDGGRIEMNLQQAVRLGRLVSESANFSKHASAAQKIMADAYTDISAALASADKRIAGATANYRKQRQAIDGLEYDLARKEEGTSRRTQNIASRSGLKYNQVFRAVDNLIDENGKVLPGAGVVKSNLQFATDLIKDQDASFETLVGANLVGNQELLNVVARVADKKPEVMGTVVRAQKLAEALRGSIPPEKGVEQAAAAELSATEPQ